MTKLSQHGEFDEELLSQVKDSLTAEFTEGEYDSFEFAQLCQRRDGSVYGTQGQCRKGTPISVKPGEGMPDIARKAKERGLKQKDVKSVADAVRAKYGAKVVKKGAPLESAARRLGERLQPQEQKPKDRPIEELGTQSLHKALREPGTRGQKAREEMFRRALEKKPKPEEQKPQDRQVKDLGKRPREATREMVRRVMGESAAKRIYDDASAKAPKPKGEGTKAMEARIQEAQRGLKRVRDLKDQAGDPNAKRLYGSVEKAMQRDIAKMARAGDVTKAKAAAAAKAAARPPTLPPKKAVVVNKKLLRVSRTSELMRILKEEKLNAYQRKRLEDELRNRGMSSSAIPKGAGRPVGRAKAPAGKADFDVPPGIKGYNPQKDMSGPGKLIGQGAMGKVKLTEGPPPGVTKQGKIGEFEAAAIKRLEGSGVTPTLHGAVVSGQAKRVSGGLGGHVREAQGYLGMSRMAGKPYGDQRWQMTPAEKAKAVDEYLGVRKAIHTRGVAHNDMHGGNFFYDKATGKGGLVDFGLAQISPKAALIEALGTTNGRDWQANRMSVGDYSTRTVRRFVANAQNVRDKMEKDFGVRVNAEIRSPMDRVNGIFGKMTDQDAERYINELYDGI